MKVSGLPEGQGQNRPNDMARAAGEGNIILSAQALAEGSP